MLSNDYKPEAWRLTDYYPDSYAKSMSALGIGIDYSGDDFDRYHAEFMADLAEHDRALVEAAAKQALEEAADAMSKKSGLDQELVSPIEFLRARAASISTDKAGTGE